MTKVQRYKVGYYTDEWGMSSITPCLIPDDSGFAVKFEDYYKLEAENERLERNLSTTEQTMREYQELAAKRLEEIERLKSLSTTLEGQLGKRACQNNRCLEYNRLAAELAKHRDAPVVAWMNTNGAFNHMKKAEQDSLQAEAMGKLTEMVRAAQKPQLDRTAELEAALEAEVMRLRNALETFIAEHEECEDGDGWMAQMCSMEALHVADEVLSTPFIHTALHELIEQETAEACAKVCKALADCDENTEPYRQGASWCEEAIRSGAWKEYK